MSDQSDNLVLIFPRRLDARMDRVLEEVADLRQRMTALEIQVGSRVATKQSHYAQVTLRMDRHETRLGGIERRLNIIDAPATS